MVPVSGCRSQLFGRWGLALFVCDQQIVAARSPFVESALLFMEADQDQEADLHSLNLLLQGTKYTLAIYIRQLLIRGWG